MDRAIEIFLDKLCIDWGFCIPPDEKTKIMELRHIEAPQFSRAVLEAEGMNPEIELEWFRKIRNRFIEEFGQVLDEADFNNAL